MTSVPDMDNREQIVDKSTPVLARAMTAFMNTYLPMACPVCGERYGYSRNKKGICDSCFVGEIARGESLLPTATPQH